MKRSFSLFLAGIFFLAVSSPVWAVTGQPTIYQVTIKKVEVSQDGNTWIVLGSGDQTMDIASVSAGAKAADYLTASNLPFGTYTQLRATISSTFGLHTPLAGVAGAATGNYVGVPLYTTNVSAAGCSNCTNVLANAATVNITVPVGASLPAGTTLDSVAGTLTIVKSISITSSASANPVIRISFDVSSGIQTIVVAGPIDTIVPGQPTVTITSS